MNTAKAVCSATFTVDRTHKLIYKFILTNRNPQLIYSKTFEVFLNLKGLIKLVLKNEININ